MYKFPRFFIQFTFFGPNILTMMHLRIMLYAYWTHSWANIYNP